MRRLLVERPTPEASAGEDGTRGISHRSQESPLMDERTPPLTLTMRNSLEARHTQQTEQLMGERTISKSNFQPIFQQAETATPRAVYQGLSSLPKLKLQSGKDCSM